MSYLESLCGVDSVESSDILKIVKCRDYGDDISLDEVFRHDTEHWSTMVGTVTMGSVISCHHEPWSRLRSQYLKSLVTTRHERYSGLVF